MPAQAAGLLPKDILVSVDGTPINTSAELRAILDNKTAGDLVRVVVARGENWQYQYSTTVNLTVSDNRTVMGIAGGDLLTNERLQNYQTFSLNRLFLYLVPPTLASGVTPFSDTLAPFYSTPIPYWQILANTLFWIWFVNFNLAIFNALPIYPFDGGRIFDITLMKVAGKRMSAEAVHRITLGVTAFCVVLVMLGIVLPFVL
jgi:membrane-associated protease RseP (regulator of RpoE activity)